MRSFFHFYASLLMTLFTLLFYACCILITCSCHFMSFQTLKSFPFPQPFESKKVVTSEAALSILEAADCSAEISLIFQFPIYLEPVAPSCQYIRSWSTPGEPNIWGTGRWGHDQIFASDLIFFVSRTVFFCQLEGQKEAATKLDPEKWLMMMFAGN